LICVSVYINFYFLFLFLFVLFSWYFLWNLWSDSNKDDDYCFGYDLNFFLF